jgi:phosphoribosylformimino-5-aminoimidazole carboxamide ribotide isomerase
MGAPRLHIVDLNGAAVGELCNLGITKEIANCVLIPTQLGGGIRKVETIEQLLKTGIERVVLGTAALENPDMVRRACHKFGESIVVSIDSRDKYIATHGWRKETDVEAIKFAQSMVRLGVKRFVHTDINRDGTLTEPNFAAIAELINAIQQPVIAAGGISSVNHVRMLKQLGAEAVIIGKALYSGDINLKEVLAAVS